MAATLTAREHSIVHDAKIRKIRIRDLFGVLAEGWDDFADKRGDILFIGIIYPAVGLIAAAAALNQNLLPFLFPLAAGLTLLGPAVASGFYELARRRECGDDPTWRHFLDVIRSDSIVSILALTIVLLAIFGLWISSAWSLYASTLGPEPPASITQFLSELFGTGQGWRLIIIGNLVGFLFAALALAISVVSFPMLVDRHVSAISAVEASVRATLRNPLPVAVWGLIVATLLVLGSIPFFIGLAVVLPLLGYSTWHLYRRLVEIDQSGATAALGGG